MGMAVGEIGISSPVFITVAGAVIFAISVALYNHYRPKSIIRAVSAGLVAAFLGMVLLTFVADEDSSGKPDETLSEASAETESVDSDADGVLDAEDECPDQPADTGNGCPPSNDTNLSAFIEAAKEARIFAEEGNEYLQTDNVEAEQVTVGSIIDPLGIRMAIGAGYRSATFTILTKRGYASIRGRVGISAEPCSSGSEAHVAIRNGEGEPLWPKSGGLRLVGATAVPFKVNVDSAAAIVFYAEAPDLATNVCDEYEPATTTIGWVHTRLFSHGD